MKINDLAYRNPEILRRMYWDEQLTQGEIGKRLGIDSRTISLWMIKLNVPRRSQALATHLRSANHVTLSQKAIAFLSGCLLGDGSLVMNKSISAAYYHTSKHREYLDWLTEQLLTFGIERIGHTTIYRRAYKDYSYLAYSCGSRSYPELTLLRNLWYATGKKQPPDELVIEPITLRQWFIDDGHYRERFRHGHLDREVRICNRCFIHDRRLLLADKLARLGIQVTIYPEGFRVRNSCIDHFFDTIGPCPVPSIYGYKWPTVTRDVH